MRPSFGGEPRGNKGMKAATIREVHSVIATWRAMRP